MNATSALPLVGVDLAKSVFQLAVADSSWRVVESHRLTRTQFQRWFVNRAIGLVVMEACGSAHHWARGCNGLGIEVRLLPAPTFGPTSNATRPTRLMPAPCSKRPAAPRSRRCV